MILSEKLVSVMKRARLIAPMLLLILLLCACAGKVRPELSSPELPSVSNEEPIASPEPTPEISSVLTLKFDGLPEDYRLTEYTAADNSTAYTDTYIDTGVSPTNQTRFWVDFECTEGYYNVESWFFGCFNRSCRLFMEVGYHLGQDNNAHFYTATGTHYSQGEDPSARTIAWLRPEDYHYPDASDGRVYYDIREPVPQTLYLFSRNNGDRNMAGDIEYLGDYALRVYGCRIWEGADTVRDYLPAVRLSDGAVGMYDRTQGRFYLSAGGGSFEAGPEALPELQVRAVNGLLAEALEIPERPGFLFRGFFTEPEGAGLCCIDEQGQPCGDAGIEDRVLYAFWERDEAWFDQY